MHHVESTIIAYDYFISIMSEEYEVFHTIYETNVNRVYSGCCQIACSTILIFAVCSVGYHVASLKEMKGFQ